MDVYVYMFICLYVCIFVCLKEGGRYQYIGYMLCSNVIGYYRV